MEKFDAVYYDGRSAARNSATLTLAEDHWIIEFVDKDGEPQLRRWDVNGIIPNETQSTLLTFKYGNFPKETLECSNNELVFALEAKYPQVHFFDKKFTYLFRRGKKAIAALTLALVAFVALLYFVILPLLAVFAANQIPRSVEMSLGNGLYNSFTHSYVVDDSLTMAVNDFAGAIDFHTDYKINVTVVKSGEVNAFALPGGNIVIFDGILREMNKKEELAALLSHEVAHVHHRHSLKNLCRSLAGYLFISVLFNDVNGIATIIADNSNMIHKLSYSRKLEREADQKGMDILAGNNISQKGFVSLFQLLEKQSFGWEVELLSSHPLTKERIRHAKATAAKQKNVKENLLLEKKWKSIKKLKNRY